MALTVGELVAYASIDNKKFDVGISDIARGLRSTQTSTSSAMASIESTVSKALADVTRDLGTAFDPAEALADVDRLVAGFANDLDRMEADAARGGQGIVNELRTAVDDLDQVMQQQGEVIGEALVDGLKAGLSDAERVARQSGEDAGKKFGDGVEGSGGRGGGGGGGGGGSRMAGIGSSLIGGLKAGAIGVAAVAGAAIGDALTGAIKTAMEREDLFATLSVKVGAFGAESERLGKIAGDLYADAYGESLGDVTDALAKVLQNIDGAGKAGDGALKDMTAQALTVSKVMDEDVGAVIRAVSQMLRTGLAKNAEEAFNILIRGQQEGVNKSEDLLDSFNEYSTIFRDFGISAEEALGLMSQGLKSGARDSDVVADSLKELTAKIKDKSAASALKELGLNANEMMRAIAKGGPAGHKALDLILTKFRDIKEPAKQAEIAAGLFGTKAEDMSKAINGINLDTAKKSIGDFKGAVDQASTTLGDTSKADADRWGRSWESVFSWVGDRAMAEVKKMFPSPADVEEQWNELTSWFSGTVGPWFSEAWTSVKDTTVEIWNGIGDWLSTKSSEIVEWLKGVPGKVKDFFVTGWNDLKSQTGEAWESIKSSASSRANQLVEWLKGVPGKVKDFFVTGWNDLKSQTVAAWESMKSQAKAKMDNLISDVKALPSKLSAIAAQAKTWLVQAGRDLIKGMIQGVQQTAGELVNAARNTVQSAVDGAKNLLGIHSPSTVFAEIGKWSVRGLIQGLEAENGNAVSTVEKMVEQIKKAFGSKPDVADHLLTFVSKGNDSLAALAKQRQELVDKLAAAKEYAKQVAGSAQEWADITGLKAEDISGAGDMAGELQKKASAINSFANNIQTLAKRGLNKKIIQDLIDAGVEKGASFAEMLVGSDGSEIKALNKAQSAVDKASKKLGKASADAMYDVGKKSGEGYLKGLQDSLAKLDKEMEKIVKSLVAAIKKQLKIKSPSQVMAEIGEFTMAGFAQGMSSMAGAVLGAAQAVVGQAVTAAQGAGSVAGMATGGVHRAGQIIGASQIAPMYGVDPKAATAAPGAGGTVVNVDMTGATIREEADVQKLGAEFGFWVAARG
ncbi:phage tail tape measure protein [Nonomuraea sp. SMC257]|uniref:Phage tail tape measure protein n=1 Tax=Nonomuraea montanisoli TaxID=2741721 RepID=A0A7Y6I8B9_9ACTN|nr:phage tail tape measure protein [Nonomuraea montanisoli]NUW33416.1 phage tail tape measure protein [Nonomuraea montanisoli]